MEQKIINVTKDYEKFKILKGNRSVTAKRIEKIKNSILEVGYVTSPILVNEKMEIIDGQGRFEVLKQLKLPIEYIVQPGISLKECIAMNVNQTNWKLSDYIKSYADAGIKDYIYLQNLLDLYPANKNVSLIASAATGVTRFATKVLMAGDYKLTEEEYENAKKNLNEIMPIFFEFKDIKGIGNIISGMLICKFLPNINYNRLYSKMKEEFAKGFVISTSKMADIINWIETIYNRNSKKEYVYIYTEYQKRMREINRLCADKAVAEKTKLSRIIYAQGDSDKKGD